MTKKIIIICFFFKIWIWRCKLFGRVNPHPPPITKKKFHKGHSTTHRTQRLGIKFGWKIFGNYYIHNILIVKRQCNDENIKTQNVLFNLFSCNHLVWIVTVVLLPIGMRRIVLFLIHSIFGKRWLGRRYRGWYFETKRGNFQY